MITTTTTITITATTKTRTKTTTTKTIITKTTNTIMKKTVRIKGIGLIIKTRNMRTTTTRTVILTMIITKIIPNWNNSSKNNQVFKHKNINKQK